MLLNDGDTRPLAERLLHEIAGVAGLWCARRRWYCDYLPADPWQRAVTAQCLARVEDCSTGFNQAHRVRAGKDTPVKTRSDLKSIWRGLGTGLKGKRDVCRCQE